MPLPPLQQFLAPDGSQSAPLPEFATNRDTLIALYRAMVLTRQFDEKAVALQRTGRLGTFASSLGQEGVSVGIASAMHENDVLLPSFREQGAQIWRGVTMTELLLYWGGDERGSDFKGPREDFPVSVPVASQIPHATGVAWAFQLRGEPRVAVGVLGDGGTSKGDFYEAINLAGAWKLPAVFVINNNQWAISVPRSAQTATETLAQKAVAAGIPGHRVDGNDVVAVRHVASEAIEAARAGQGPALIEAVTYRLTDHTTADDAHRYRDDKEVSAHWKKDPVARLRNHLVQQSAWTKADEEALIANVAGDVQAAVDAYLDTPAPELKTLFAHTYADMPADLIRQADAATRTWEGSENG
jgi:2-oxoisovalerate dehydrogenase E1 component alpha subunit